MIRVDDLQFLPVPFHPTRDDPLLPQRQQLPRPARIAAEINEADDVACAVGRLHPERPAPARLAILGRRQRHGDDAAGIGLIQLVHRLPIDPADGQVEQHVDDSRQAELAQRTGQRGADAFQRLDFGEQRIENIGAHD
jgi:hypothetical protein